MKFAYSRSIFKAKSKKEAGGFSDFFLNASDQEKMKILKEAAQKANEEQKKVFSKSHSKARA